VTPADPPTGTLTGAAADARARIAPDRLEPLLRLVADRCRLGDITDWHVITTGFEDCNVRMRCAHATVVVKVFGTHRQHLAGRTAEILRRVVAAGVNHPRLHTDQNGLLLHRRRGTSALVMDAVDAADYYALDRPPTRSELTGIVDQAALVHTIDAEPDPVDDPWAVTNLGTLYTRMRPFLDAEHDRLAHRALTALDGVDRATLPHVFAHGDLTKGNVLACETTGRIHLVDFAVANRLPRIQELAVAAANLTHGAPEPLPQRAELLGDLYAAACGLTGHERRALPVFAFAAAAMEYLGALAEQHLGGNTGDEVAYLVDLGSTGLRQAACIS
jgi:hypothetical protein